MQLEIRNEIRSSREVFPLDVPRRLIIHRHRRQCPCVAIKRPGAFAVPGNRWRLPEALQRLKTGEQLFSSLFSSLFT